MTLAQNAVRRTATYAAAAALAGGALLAGAGSASADAVVDLTGLVTNSAGAPLANVGVSAYAVSADGGADFSNGDFATTDATGRYNLDSLETEGTQFKLFFRDQNPANVTNPRALPYRGTYLGKAQYPKSSPTVTITPGTPTTAPTEALVQNAGLAVTILNPAGVPVTNGDATTLLPQANLGYEFPATAFAAIGSDDSAYDNPATPAVEPAPKDGVAFFDNLEGSQPVKVLASGDDVPDTGIGPIYLSKFLGGSGFSYDGATVITPVAGQITSVTIQLNGAFKPIQAPRILGNTVKGKTLTADPGVWPINAGTEFNYQWLRGATVVSTEKTYKVTKADKKKKLRLLITAVNDDFVGQAGVTSAKVGFASKVKVKKAGDDELRATVTVSKKKDRKKAGAVKGKVTVYDETGARVSKKAKLKGGSATIKVREVAEGKLTVVYLGGGKLGTDSANVGGGKGKGGKKN